MTDHPTSRSPQLNTTLADLAAHWEQMADHYNSVVGCFEGPTAATLDVEVGERSRTYRNAAADLREVLDTGRIPHDLVAAATVAQVTEQDAVIERKDREYATCERLLREAYEENARLRSGQAPDDKAYAELLRTAEPVPETRQD